MDDAGQMARSSGCKNTEEAYNGRMSFFHRTTETPPPTTREQLSAELARLQQEKENLIAQITPPRVPEDETLIVKLDRQISEKQEALNGLNAGDGLE